VPRSNVESDYILEARNLVKEFKAASRSAAAAFML
jgi:hypothetical protein